MNLEPKCHHVPFPLDSASWQSVRANLELSPQQVEVTELLLRGYQDIEISEELGISVSTIRTYFGRIFERTSTCSRLTLVLTIFATAMKLR